MKYRCNPFLDKDYDSSNPVIEVNPAVWLLLVAAKWYVALALMAATAAGICAIALLSPVMIPIAGICSLSSGKKTYGISGF